LHLYVDVIFLFCSSRYSVEVITACCLLQDGLVIPISHSDDSFEINNLNTADVPEYKGKDESPMETGTEISDSCAIGKDITDTSNSQLARHEKVNKAGTRNLEFGTRWKASSKNRLANRNFSSFPRSDRYRDRQWRDEQYQQKMEYRRRKLPSDANVRERGVDHSVSEEMVNGETAVSEPFVDRVSHQQSLEDYKAELLAESKDHSSSEYARPSGHKQKSSAYQRRRYYTHDKGHFSSAYSHYSVDYDDYEYHDAYVSRPKRYRDPKRNRQLKSTKTKAEVVSDDVGNKHDEESSYPDSDHAASSSAVSSVGAVVSSNRPNKSELDDADAPRQTPNNGYRIFRITRDRQTPAAPEENDTLPAGAAYPEQCQNDSNASCNVEMKGRTPKHRPRKQWNRQPPDKVRRPSVHEDEELQTTASALSQLSIKERKDDDMEGGRDSVKEMEACSTLTEQKCVKQTDKQQTGDSNHSREVRSQSKRYSRTRQNEVPRFAKERRASRLDQHNVQDSVEVTKDSSYSAEPKFAKQSERGVDQSDATSCRVEKESHQSQTGTDKCCHEVEPESRINNRTRRDDIRFPKERWASQGDQHSGQDTAKVMKDFSYFTEPKRVTTGTDSSHTLGVGSRSKRNNNRMRKSDTYFASDPVSHEQQRSDRSDAATSCHAEKEPHHQKYTDSFSQEIRSQGRRSDGAKASRDNQHGRQERSDGISYRVEKEANSQKHSGGRRGDRTRFHRDSWPSSGHQRSRDNATDKLADVPSTKPDHQKESG